jgi:hypothetical protein
MAYSEAEKKPIFPRNDRWIEGIGIAWNLDLFCLYDGIIDKIVEINLCR